MALAYPAAVQADHGQPPFAFVCPEHAAKARGVSLHTGPILLILRVSHYTQIAALIVETITVNVIDFQAVTTL